MKRGFTRIASSSVGRPLEGTELDSVLGGGGPTDVVVGQGRVDVTTYGSYTSGQADRAGIDAANGYLGTHPDENYVDLQVNSQDRNGNDFTNTGGWTSQDSSRTDGSALAPDRPDVGGFDAQNGEGGNDSADFG
jgi:hypothetical protein